ncbi:MAG: NAD(P)H-dependent oxidoreductase [Treponema sp.]|nr:NAD(P)H-dependent oxidoreductase [Treponema sp.]
MKILVLNGSPKCEKSDTMHITNAFIKGMNEKSNQDVHIINVIEKKLNFAEDVLPV